MGNDPRKVSIQAVFAGETYLADYHKLEAALNERGAGELVHPIFGILNVQVVSHTVHHDEQSYDSCMISIEFIKAKADKKEVFLDAELIDGINIESVLKNPASALDLALEKLKVLDNNKYILQSIAFVQAYKIFINTWALERVLLKTSYRHQLGLLV
jgi:prophage DNA circulation protein